jgi:molybdate transport system substrate-binding protein
MQKVESAHKFSFFAAATTGLMLLLFSTVAEAAELKIMGALGTRAVLEDLGPKFERASGHKLVIIFDGVTAIVKRVQAGETADVVMISRQGIDGFVKDGKVAASNVTVFARAGTGVAIRKGAPKPDISSSEALKRALLSAKSISCPDPKLGGATGIHFEKVLDRLGIRDEVRAKTVFPNPPGGAAIARIVASGEAEIGVHLIQELLEDTGIEIVGPLPGDLQNIIVMAAAIMANAKDVPAAKALVDFLRAPAAATVIRAKGMEPATQ